jgi:hypothetical protein
VQCGSRCVSNGPIGMSRMALFPCNMNIVYIRGVMSRVDSYCCFRVCFRPTCHHLSWPWNSRCSHMWEITFLSPSLTGVHFKSTATAHNKNCGLFSGAHVRLQLSFFNTIVTSTAFYARELWAVILALEQNERKLSKSLVNICAAFRDIQLARARVYMSWTSCLCMASGFAIAY